MYTQGEGEASVYHTSKVISTGGVELQSMGKDFLWIGRAETRVKSFGANKTTLGFASARLVDGGFLPRKVSTSRHPLLLRENISEACQVHFSIPSCST